MKRLTVIERKVLLDILLPYLEDEYIIFEKEKEKWTIDEKIVRLTYITTLQDIAKKLQKGI